MSQLKKQIPDKYLLLDNKYKMENRGGGTKRMTADCPLFNF